MAAFRVGLPIQAYGPALLKCFIGAFILRSSACTINDIFDRKMDAGVGKLSRSFEAIFYRILY